MGQALLVNIDLNTSAEIIRILDEAPVRVSVALWVSLEEYSDWRFLLSSRQLDAAGPMEAYGLVHDALREAGFPVEKTPPMLILSMADPTVRALRRYFRQAEIVEGTRVGSQQFGNRWVEDGYVYRVS
jgi:hypothetical protein